jgi:hypothetical protein
MSTEKNVSTVDIKMRNKKHQKRPKCASGSNDTTGQSAGVGSRIDISPCMCVGYTVY